MILKKCVSTFSDKVKKIITNSTMITETTINSELFTSNSILVHNPITKNKLIFFQKKKARHTCSNCGISIYKNNFKTKLLSSKKSFLHKVYDTKYG